MIVYNTDISEKTPGIIQFENANEGRSYPFADNSMLVSDEGRTLDDNVISDMHLVIPTGTNAMLSSVYISNHMISVCIKVMKDGLVHAALSCTVKKDELEPYIPYRMEKLTGSEDVGGIVTFGAFDFYTDGGMYRFGTNQIRLAESAVNKYTPAKLRRIVDDRNGDSVSGDVKIEFSSHIQANRDDAGVGLSLRPGSNEALLSKCDKEKVANPCGSEPVMRINGVLADDKQRIVIWFH